MKKFAAALSVLMLASTLLTACGDNGGKEAGDGKAADGGARAQSQQVKQQAQGQARQNVRSAQESQKGLYEDRKLEAAILKVQNVKHATVMVAGTTAYVMVEDAGAIHKSDITAPNTNENILRAKENAAALPTAMKNDIRDTIIRTNPNLRTVVFMNQ